jgi:hypothetical protein
MAADCAEGANICGNAANESQRVEDNAFHLRTYDLCAKISEKFSLNLVEEIKYKRLNVQRLGRP